MSNSTKIVIDRHKAKTGDVVPQKGNNFSAQPVNSPAGQLLSLHRTIGNRAVGRMFRKGPLLQRFVTYYNAGSALAKFEALLQVFAFAPLREVLRLEGGRHSLTQAAS